MSCLGVARDLLQARIPIVECACFEGKELEAHHAALNRAADNHHVAAVVGAGWDPGVLPLMRSAFEMLIPRGHTVFHRHPGLSLHHTAAAAGVRGVKDALAGEYRGSDGSSQHYVYVELERGMALAHVQAEIAADPLFAGEVTQVFQVECLSDLEGEEGLGVVLDRRGSAAPTARTRACCWRRASNTSLSRPASCSTPCANSPVCAGAHTATRWDSDCHSRSCAAHPAARQ